MYNTIAPGAGQSYRLGDYARPKITDGDYVAIIRTVEGAKTQKNDNQLKVTADLLGPHMGQKHTWWYNITEAAIFRFFTDLIALGFEPSFDAGPPVDQMGNFIYPQRFAPAMINQVVQLRVSSRAGSEFQNTAIVGRAAIGPDGQPVLAGPAPAAVSGPPPPAPAPGYGAPAPVPGYPSAAGAVPAPVPAPSAPAPVPGALAPGYPAATAPPPAPAPGYAGGPPGYPPPAAAPGYPAPGATAAAPAGAPVGYGNVQPAELFRSS